MISAIQVITTTSTRENALDIARALVDRRLAACVQIVGPIASVYRWQGKVEESAEWQCVIKTRIDLFPALEGAIRALHPYQVPEILATPVVAGGGDYLGWMDGELSPAGQTRLPEM